jgi:hypothetical protein
MTVVDLEALKAKAKESKDLLEDSIFTQAVLALRQQWFAEVMAAKSKEEREDLWAQIKALEAIPKQLQVFINDYKMAAQRKG